MRINKKCNIEYVIIVILSIMCMLLVIQNYRLKYNEISATKMIDIIKTGERLPIIKYVNTSDEMDSLTFLDTGYSCYILAVFRSECGGCNMAWPIWADLKHSAPPNTRFIGFTTENTESIDSLTHKIAPPFDIGIVLNPERFQERFGIVGVPTTIIVGSGGIFHSAWTGPIDNKGKKMVLKAIEECDTIAWSEVKEIPRDN